MCIIIIPYLQGEYMKAVFTFGGRKKKIKVFTLRLGKAQPESLAYGDYTWGLSCRQFWCSCVCVCNYVAEYEIIKLGWW